MKIILDEVTYDVPDEIIDAMLQDTRNMLTESYLKQPEEWRFAEKLLSRHLLQGLESNVKKQGLEIFEEITQVIGMDIRPPRRSDPNVHLMGLMLRFLREMLVRYVALAITTSPTGDGITNSVTFAITGKGEGGRQMVGRRYDWDGQNDLEQESPQELGEAVPDEQDLHTGYELQRGL